jgi:putative ABC transport system ATP-binding protein
MPDLCISDLTVEYTDGGSTIRPLDHLSLDVAAGSLVLLLGPSGCGKTTLLSCLGSILTPTGGSITFGDTEITELKGASLTEFRRNTIGIVFQAFNLVESLTAVENVALPLRAAGLGWPEANRRAGELLERLNLGDRLHHRPSGMSGGQQQRVALARALALDPPLILADEPTAHLDYIQVEVLLQNLREIASGERIVVVATHDHRLVPLADKVIELVPDLGATDLPPTEVQLTTGQILFEQGSWGDRIYVVEGGEIEIVVHRSPGQDEEVVATVQRGNYFGEMGPLFNLPRTATARAGTAARVVGYTVRDFRRRIGPGRDLMASDQRGVPPDMLDGSP